MVGMLVGLTGVGGGSLMTPLLVLLFNFHPATAVGTDRLYASVTKSAPIIASSPATPRLRRSTAGVVAGVATGGLVGAGRGSARARAQARPFGRRRTP